MKGLLIKDFELMKIQKKFMMLIFLIGIFMSVFSADLSFVIGFITFTISLFTLNTISYDEFDNGYAFLFTLPITRKSYAIEKYCFGLIIGTVSWLVATALAIVSSLFHGILPISDILLTAVIILILMPIIQSIIIPFQIKFGSEKGRIAMISVFGLLFLLSAVSSKGLEWLGLDIGETFNHFVGFNSRGIVSVLLLVSILFFLVSIKISIIIMKKKEF